MSGWRVPAAPRTRSSPRTAALAALTALVALIAFGVLAHRHAGDPLAVQALTEMRRLVRAAMLTGAGLLGLAVWRLTQRREVAMTGAALLVLGVVTDSVTAVVPVLARTFELPYLVPLLRPIPATVGAVLLIAAAAGRAARSIRAARTTVLLTVLLPAVCVAVTVPLVPTAAGETSRVALAAAAWRFALWCGVAVHTARSAQPALGLLPLLLALLACAAAADAGAAMGYPTAIAYGTLFTAAAAATAVLSTTSAVRQAITEQRLGVARLLHDIGVHRERERTAQEADEEQRHEVRSVLAGVQGAVTTLRHYEAQLEPDVRRRLEEAVTVELGRLGHLIDAAPSGPVTSVVLADTLGPLLRSEQSRGLDLEVELGDTAVRGRRADVVTVVGLLLCNARAHAPEAPVTVRCEVVGTTARVIVADAGPGIPDAQRERVFERGVRGRTSAPGDGLGLFTARRLARLMHGTLHAEHGPGSGARLVLTLPTATAATAPD